MFSWSPRASDEEDTLCPCLAWPPSADEGHERKTQERRSHDPLPPPKVVPEGMEFVFAVREAGGGGGAMKSREQAEIQFAD